MSEALGFGAIDDQTSLPNPRCYRYLPVGMRYVLRLRCGGSRSRQSTRLRRSRYLPNRPKRLRRSSWDAPNHNPNCTRHRSLGECMGLRALCSPCAALAPHDSGSWSMYDQAERTKLAHPSRQHSYLTVSIYPCLFVASSALALSWWDDIVHHASFVRDPCAHALTHTSRCVGYPGLLSLRSRCSNTCSYASCWS